ncbi:MAG: 3-methyl-2-oxobutanoate hydroxymethyltransferase, partial [bacterium]
MTIPALRARKSGAKLVCLTAYDAPTGALLDAAGVDVVLVGDSVGNVVLGLDSTLPVTMDDMLHHVRAVARGVRRALLVADMPFMSYQAEPADALRNAGLLIKAGAAAVKLEGGRETEPAVRALVASGIPVMGHLGLTPQRVHEFGGYRAQGKDAAAAHRIWREARLLDRLGVFAVVLECVPGALAGLSTRAVGCPTIG